MYSVIAIAIVSYHKKRRIIYAKCRQQGIKQGPRFEGLRHQLCATTIKRSESS
ncbi:Uncharacterised protein [Vibrio cholerae]|nr:Uncharacterised protein [Vibrio cholerae]CSI74278.1 Uncharacterised protein [Vibrio cholerae]